MASSGWWLAYLLAIAYVINCWQHQRSVSFEYKFSTIIAFGLSVQTQCIHLGLRFSHHILNVVLYLFAPITTSLLIFLCLNQGKIDFWFLKWKHFKTKYIIFISQVSFVASSVDSLRQSSIGHCSTTFYVECQEVSHMEKHRLSSKAL